MKKYLRFLVYINIVLSLLAHLYAQNQGQPLTDLFVRRLNGRVTLTGALLGLGTSASAAGDQILWRQSDASATGWNPAALGLLQQRSLIVDWVPPGITQKLSDLYDVDSEIQSEMDQVIEDNGTLESEVIYPSIQSDVGLKSVFSGLGFAVPFQINGRSCGAGFTYTMPMSFDMQFSGSGIEAGIQSEQDIDDEIRLIRMRTSMNMNAILNIMATKIQFGFGIMPDDRSSLGMTVFRLFIDASMRASALIDGLIEMSGSEYAFNDLLDPRFDFESNETNALDQSFYTKFEGSAWGLKLGYIREINEKVQFGLTVALPSRLNAPATKYSLTHKIKFLDVESDAENLDDRIDATKIDLAKLTSTEREEKNEVYDLYFDTPASYNLGFLYADGLFSLSLRTTLYSGSFGYEIVDHDLHGFNFKYGFGLGLDFKYFFLGTSISIVDELVPEDWEDEPQLNLPLPKLNVGFRIPITSRFWLDGLIGVEPTPLMKLTGRIGF